MGALFENLRGLEHECMLARRFLCSLPLLLLFSASAVQLGIDVLFENGLPPSLQGKRVGLVTNQTGIDSAGRTTIDRFKEWPQQLQLVALFGPEHGIRGDVHADYKVEDGRDCDGIPIYSLYGSTRRPTAAMLQNVDLMVFDIQDVGLRCYTFISTLFYVMEEAAKQGIGVMVLDRPNPINGLVVDGPMLEPQWRSFVGYIDVPFCHGMTVGELAQFFNAEYGVGCSLTVVPMKGWKRSMSFHETGLVWMPTSPQIPEADSPLYYATTGVLGEAQTAISIGVGYTLPFKVVGAPWIDAQRFAQALNDQGLPGIRFHPWHFRPFFGRHATKECAGVRLIITDPIAYRPITTQFIILGLLKTLYPDHFLAGVPMKEATDRMLAKIIGTEEIYERLTSAEYIGWALASRDADKRQDFLTRRRLYLLYD
jgi:uncharacterized protein YbbC (DUF1343 family)